VAAFIESPASRLKDQCPNIVVLVGYLMCLPSATVDTLLPTGEAWRAFWLNVFGESLRRASDGIYAAEKTEMPRCSSTRSCTATDDAAAARRQRHRRAPVLRCEGAPRHAAPRRAARERGDNDDDDDDDGANPAARAVVRAASPAAEGAAGKGKAAPAAVADAKVRTRRRVHTAAGGVCRRFEAGAHRAVRAR
jgi:hypothetical protein